MTHNELSPSEQIKISGYTVFKGLISTTESVKYLHLIKKFWDTEPHINPKFAKRFPQWVINNLPVRTRAFDALLAHPEILKIGTDLLGTNFTLGEMRACNVEKCDEVAFVHRDGFIPTIPGFPLALVAMWTLEEFSKENGATLFYPGSHASPHRPTDEILKSFSPTFFEAPAGSLVIFDANLWHGPSINSSGKSRWSLNSYYTRWFIKPTFDMAARFTYEEFKKLPTTMKELLGFTTSPPRDETKRIATVISVNEVEESYPFSL